MSPHPLLLSLLLSTLLVLLPHPTPAVLIAWPSVEVYKGGDLRDRATTSAYCSARGLDLFGCTAASSVLYYYKSNLTEGLGEYANETVYDRTGRVLGANLSSSLDFSGFPSFWRGSASDLYGGCDEWETSGCFNGMAYVDGQIEAMPCSASLALVCVCAGGQFDATPNPTTIAPTSDAPSKSPTGAPTRRPTRNPTLNPTKTPTAQPTIAPTASVLMVQQGSALSTTGNVGTSLVGFATAVSADGNVAFVTAPNDDSNKGSMWVYDRALDGTWSIRSRESPGIAGDKFGTFVSCDASGTKLLVGSQYDGGATVGKVFFGSYNSSGWTWVTVPQTVGVTYLGAAPSIWGSNTISGDGTVAIIGASGDTGGGAFQYYRISGTSVTFQTRIASPSATSFGTSVAVNYDGTILVVGASSGVGAVYVYQRFTGNDTWALQQTITQPSDDDYVANFGFAVGVNSVGTYLAVAGQGVFTSTLGAAWVYKWSGVQWETQTNATGGYMLRPTDWLVDGSPMDRSAMNSKKISLNSDATRLVYGARVAHTNVGRVWAWTRAGTVWSQTGLGRWSSPTSDRFGYSVSISDDGTTAIVGAVGYNSFVGTAFVLVDEAWTLTPTTRPTTMQPTTLNPTTLNPTTNPTTMAPTSTPTTTPYVVYSAGYVGANLGIRASSDGVCATAVENAGRTCGQTIAIISYDASDHITSFEYIYGLNPTSTVVGPSGVRIANSWIDFINRAIVNNLALAIFGSTISEKWWTGYDILFGGSVATTSNCNMWTSSISGNTGRIGDMSLTSGSMFSEAYRLCNSQAVLLCLCVPPT